MMSSLMMIMKQYPDLKTIIHGSTLPVQLSGGLCHEKRTAGRWLSHGRWRAVRRVTTHTGSCSEILNTLALYSIFASFLLHGRRQFSSAGDGLTALTLGRSAASESAQLPRPTSFTARATAVAVTAYLTEIIDWTRRPSVTTATAAEWQVQFGCRGTVVHSGWQCASVHRWH